MELISVIVPVYKVERYLDQCIESVVSQTYHNIEIILVDDGSPDRCPEICDAWAEKDQRIRVIHKKNGGLSDARNAGMKASTGAYISFIDSDDVIEPEFLEYLYKALCETGADLSECSYRKFSDSIDNFGSEKSMSAPAIQTGEDALYHFSNFITPENHMVWDKLYRRELIENEPFLYGRQSQDVLFSCHVFGKCRKIALIDNVLYYWRVRQGSASAVFFKQRMDALETYWLSIKYLEKFYPQFVKDLKNSYLSLCFGAYEWILWYGPEEKRAEGMKTVNSYRRRIKYSKEEWADISSANKVRYILSNRIIISPAVKARNMIYRLKEFGKSRI